MLRAFKNVSVVASTHLGRESYILFGSDGRENSGFTIWIQHHIARATPFNTRKTYATGICLFFDYLEAASVAIEEPLNTLRLKEIIESWNSYLVFAEESSNPLAKKVATAMGNEKVSASTSWTYHQGLKSFLELSEVVKEKAIELQSLGLLDNDFIIDKDALIDASAKTEVDRRVRNALVKNSVMAGVIKDGPKLMRLSKFPKKPGSKSKRKQKLKKEKRFPYDSARDLIKAGINPRDRALLALAASGGMRICECVQVLTDDIDYENQRIVCESPFNQLDHPAYEVLSEAEQEKLLCDKSRVTEFVFMIEPFNTLFWENLDLYLEEYFPLSEKKASFLFKKIDADRYGDPLITASKKTINKIFTNAADKVLGVGHGYTWHSLRHMYGWYLKNYCPNLHGGYGLSLSLVQQFMGHAELSSTLIYDITDDMLAEMQIEFANRHIFLPDSPKTIAEYQKEILTGQLKVLIQREEERQALLVAIDD